MVLGKAPAHACPRKWYVARSVTLTYCIANVHVSFCSSLGYRIGVEFRLGAWLEPRRREWVFSFLREHGLAYVCVDEP